MNLTNMLNGYKNKLAVPKQNVPSQANNLYKSLASMGAANNTSTVQQPTPTPPVFQQPEKFSYDAATDPQLANALQQANASAKTATNDAMVGLGARGIGNSSIAIDRGNQIQQAATSNVYTNMLPQFIKQAYDQYQNGITNKYNTDLANYNVGRDQVGDNHWQQTYDAGRTDQADNLAINQGQLTGDYTNPNLVNLLKKQSENSAAYASASPEQRTILHQQNIDISKQLGQTYNEAKGTYSTPNTTIRTIAGQTLDSNKRQEHIDLAQKLSEMYGVHVDPKNDPALAYKQVAGLVPLNKQKQDFDQQYQTKAQALDKQQVGISQQNANTSSASSGNSASNAKINQLFDAWKARGTAPAGLESLGIEKDTPYAGQEPSPSATENKQNQQSDYVSGFDGLKPEQRKLAFKKEKATIIKDLGIAGYNSLYSMYFDQHGDPIEEN